MDVGLSRCQQMFADLNRYAIRPSTSIGVLYDHRDEMAHVTKHLVQHSAFFRDLVEMEKTTLAPRSRRLFTLSALYVANKALLQNFGSEEIDTRVEVSTRFWETVAQHIPEWNAVRERKLAAGDVRRDFIHSHGVVLQALGKAGAGLIRRSKKTWPDKLKRLSALDWSRSNAELWEGRALVGGRVQKPLKT